MFRKISLGRFKSFEHKTFDLKDLTVFTGTNSGGKSTILHGLAVIAQSCMTKGFAPLILNGEFVQLGKVENLINEDSQEKTAEISITVDLPHSDTHTATRAELTIKFDAAGLSYGPDKVPHFLSMVIDCQDTSGNLISGISLSWDPAHSETVLPGIVNAGVKCVPYVAEFRNVQFAPGWLAKSRFKGDSPTGLDDILFASASIAGVQFSSQDLIPEYVVTRFDAVEYLTRKLYGQIGLAPHFETIFQAFRVAFSLPLCKPEMQPIWEEFMGDISSVENAEKLINFLRQRKSADFKEYVYEAIPINDLSAELGVAILILSTVNNRIRYLGPLRRKPALSYAYESARNPYDVGVEGEFAAKVLEAQGEQIISYFAPPDQSQVFRRDTKTTLNEAVNAWVRYLEIGESVAGGDTFNIIPIGSTKSRTLNEVGVGASQVLPILVSGLLSKRGDTLLIEQPELHLHPMLQSKLSDFFVSIISAGRQILLETHSEHIINRLAIHIAQSPGTELSDKVGIYFIHKNGKYSDMQPIIIDKYGRIEEWPDGFFDQASKDSVKALQAGYKKMGS
ncbi:MAG: DUF3696 domain-containing protein [Elusimicrobiota bacterium]|nr:DUF3696 domain-containing protein [Elusimicrobiota bacterium]